MGVNGNANGSEVLLQNGSSREDSTSSRWITPLAETQGNAQIRNVKHPRHASCVPTSNGNVGIPF